MNIVPVKATAPPLHYRAIAKRLRGIVYLFHVGTSFLRDKQKPPLEVPAGP